MRKLAFDDIQDLREYDRERDEFRRRIIEMKKRRRVQLGDLLTITFENTDTMRFQVQEMARIERMLTDEQIRNELDTYNTLIPGQNELSGTLFVEIDNKERLYEWLPKLVGIERAVSIWLHDGSSMPSTPEDEERLWLALRRLPPEAAEVVAAGDGPAAEAARRWLDDVRHRALDITGDDLVAAGLSGPAVGAGLEAAMVAMLDGHAPDRDAQLAAALTELSL